MNNSTWIPRGNVSYCLPIWSTSKKFALRKRFIKFGLLSRMTWLKHVFNWISHKFFVDWMHLRVKRIRRMTINLILELLLLALLLMMALKRFVKFSLVSWTTWFKHVFNWISHIVFANQIFILSFCQKEDILRRMKTFKPI